MNFNNFIARFKAEKIRIEPSDQPGSAIVTENRYDPYMGDPIEDAVSNIQIVHIQAERDQLANRTAEQIKSIRDAADLQLAEYDAALKACKAVLPPLVKESAS